MVEEMEASHKPPSRHHAGDPEDLSYMRFVGPTGKEAADVANMAMMVADVAGALVHPMHRLRTHSPSRDEEREVEVWECHGEFFDGPPPRHGTGRADHNRNEIECGPPRKLGTMALRTHSPGERT